MLFPDGVVEGSKPSFILHKGVGSKENEGLDGLELAKGGGPAQEGDFCTSRSSQCSGRDPRRQVA
ncbi:MAG: hypothetical protein PVI42_18290 [Desulfobacterales bacterium]